MLLNISGLVLIEVDSIYNELNAQFTHLCKCNKTVGQMLFLMIENLL